MDEEFNRLVLECANCHLEYYAPQLRPHPQTNSLMCINCFKAPGSKLTVLKDRSLSQKKPTFRSQVRPSPITARPALKPVVNQPLQARARPTSPHEYVTFKCGACHYTLRRKGSYVGNCPYCDKATLRRS